MGIAGYLFLEYMGEKPDYRRDSRLGEAIGFSALSLVPLFYIGLMELLFLRPMRANRDWIAGKFSVTSRGPASSGAGEIDIIKGEKVAILLGCGRTSQMGRAKGRRSYY